MKDSSLIVVGCGIKFASHLTVEAKANIEQADKVLYLVNEPVMKKWIQDANKSAQSLDQLYTKYPLRLHCYRAITEHILNEVRENQHVCVVIYGHPTIFAQPALDALIKAREEGYYARALPGISAEDCLFADLLINPGSAGYLSFEATDLLIRRRQIDPSCHVILWQVDVIGMIKHAISWNNKKGASILVDYLQQYYDLSHKITLYQAAQYPGMEPSIKIFPLRELPEIEFSPISSLYIPPVYKPEIDRLMLDTLEVNITDLI